MPLPFLLGRGKKRKKGTLPVANVFQISLLALKESADAFPPLKSAVGGVLAVWEIVERTKHCKSEGIAIAQRTVQILDIIADAVPDPTMISGPMLQSINKFTLLLDDIQRCMRTTSSASALSRVVHLKDHERTLQNINVALDEAYRDFVLASSLRVEVQQSTMTDKLSDLRADHGELMLKQAVIEVKLADISVGYKFPLLKIWPR